MRSAANPAPQVVIRGSNYSGDYIVAVVNSELVTAAESSSASNASAPRAARGAPPRR